MKPIPGWGFLRFFLWLAPGFAAICVLATLRFPGTPFHCPETSMRYLIAATVVLGLVACCGWLDSFVIPTSHRIRGVSPRRRVKWTAYFAVIQIPVLPMVALIFLALAEANGIRV